MDLAEFKEKYPDLYKLIFDEGVASGRKEGFAEGETAGIEKGKVDGRTEGATAEKERIRNIEAQAIPGHEDLIQEMKFDGKTTGEQAAVKILQAEKTMRETAATQLAADGIKPVAHVVAPNEGDGTENMPDGPEKWKAEYEADAKLQEEFKVVETYVAFKQGVADGRIKILGKKV